MSKEEKIVGQIFETTDYDKFKVLNGNRAVDKSRIKKIAASIEHVGYRKNPIVVNSNMEVIDGQGRLEVLKSQGKPVYYIIDDTAGIKECRALNNSSTNWRRMDFVDSIASSGNDDYKKLKAYMEEFRDIGNNIVLAVCAGMYSNGQATEKLIRDETFKLTRDDEEIRDILTYLSRFTEFNKSKTTITRNVWGAILQMMSVKKCDRESLYNVFKRLPDNNKYVFARSREAAAEQIREMYNKESRVRQVKSLRITEDELKEANK